MAVKIPENLTQLEKKYINTLIEGSDKNTKKQVLEMTRLLNHINYFVSVRRIQIGALSDKIQEQLSQGDYQNKFEMFKSITQRYMVEGTEFGNAMATMNLLVDNELKKSKKYSKEYKELTKVAAFLSLTTSQTLDNFKKTLDEISGLL